MREREIRGTYIDLPSRTTLPKSGVNYLGNVFVPKGTHVLKSEKHPEAKRCNTAKHCTFYWPFRVFVDLDAREISCLRLSPGWCCTVASTDTCRCESSTCHVTSPQRHQKLVGTYSVLSLWMQWSHRVHFSMNSWMHHKSGNHIIGAYRCAETLQPTLFWAHGWCTQTLEATALWFSTLSSLMHSPPWALQHFDLLDALKPLNLQHYGLIDAPKPHIALHFEFRQRSLGTHVYNCTKSEWCSLRGRLFNMRNSRNQCTKHEGHLAIAHQSSSQWRSVEQQLLEGELPVRVSTSWHAAPQNRPDGAEDRLACGG